MKQTQTPTVQYLHDEITKAEPNSRVIIPLQVSHAYSLACAHVHHTQTSPKKQRNYNASI